MKRRSFFQPIIRLAHRIIDGIRENGALYVLTYHLGLHEFTSAVLLKIHDDWDKLQPNILKNIYSVRFGNRGEKKCAQQLIEIVELRRCNVPTQQQCAQVIKELNNAPRRFSTRWLDDMEELAMMLGLMKVAFECRKIQMLNLERKYDRRRKVIGRDALKLFWSYIYLSRKQDACQVLERTDKRCHEKFGLAFKQLCCISGLARNRYPINESFDFTKHDEIYRGLIQDKCIAVLGPSSSAIDVEAINQDNDKVIWITYQGKNHLVGDRKKCRADISYYNVGNMEKLNKTYGEIPGFFKDLTFTVFKDISHPFQQNLLKEGRGKLCRQYPSSIFSKGVGNMIQLVLMDIIPLSPKKITVYNTNFYLSKRIYYEGYSTFGFDDREECWGFANHNILSQYEFSKLLFDNKIFEADKECAHVLGLGLEEYMAQMDERYGQALF